MANIPFTTYAFPATGASTNRTMPDRLGLDTVNVLEFGADSTGQSDSTIAIQNAINQAYSNLFGANHHGGSRVFFPAGTYMISSPI